MFTTLNPVSILSGKGGVGKTFFAMNLAKFMAMRKNKVLLVDMDWAFAGLTQFLLRHNPQLSPIIQSTQRFLDLLTTSIPSREALSTLISQSHQITANIPDFPSYLAEYLGILPHVMQAECPSVPNPRNTITLSSNFIKFLVGVQQLGYNYIIFDTDASPVSTTIQSAIFSNTLIFIAESDTLSSQATNQLKNWILQEEAGTIRAIEKIMETNIEWQPFLKQWYRAIRMERKLTIWIANCVSAMSKKFNPLSKRWEIPWEETVAAAYDQGSTLIDNDIITADGIAISKINSHYLYCLLKIYQYIAERYNDSTEDLYILEENRDQILQQLAVVSNEEDTKEIEGQSSKISSELQQQYQQFVAQHEKLKEEHQELILQYEQLKQAHQAFIQSNEQHSCSEKGVNQERDRLQKERDSVLQAFQGLEQKYDTLQLEYQKLQTECKKIQNDYAKLQQEHRQKTLSYIDLQHECDRLTSAINAWISTLTELRQKNTNKAINDVLSEFEPLIH